MNNTGKKLFPWLCICCKQEFSGEPAHRHPWGRLCWMLGAEAEDKEEQEGEGEVVTPVEIKA
jgi:hypothetical protein